MEEIRVNRLPLLTYRYLHTNDTPLSFETPKGKGSFTFSDITHVKEGGALPENFDGASKETVLAAEKGSHYTITIPQGEDARLVIDVQAEEGASAAFLFRLEKGASLSLTWKLTGGDREETCVLAAYYELAEDARLHVSRLESGLTKTIIYDQRHSVLAARARADFYAAELGGEKIIVHSYGKLSGDASEMNERAIYAGRGRQHLDFFYHIDHVGKKT